MLVERCGRRVEKEEKTGASKKTKRQEPAKRRKDRSQQKEEKTGSKKKKR